MATPKDKMYPFIAAKTLDEANRQAQFRWQFLAGCEWACLSPWVSIQSEDGRYWKCETWEMVQSILASKYRTTEFADDGAEWVDEKKALSISRRSPLELSWRRLLLICVVCIKVVRECWRGRPRKKEGKSVQCKRWGPFMYSV